MSESQSDKVGKGDGWKLYCEAFNALFGYSPGEEPVSPAALQEMVERLTPSAEQRGYRFERDDSGPLPKERIVMQSHEQRSAPVAWILTHGDSKPVHLAASDGWKVETVCTE